MSANNSQTHIVFTSPQTNSGSTAILQAQTLGVPRKRSKKPQKDSVHNDTQKPQKRQDNKTGSVHYGDEKTKKEVPERKVETQSVHRLITPDQDRGVSSKRESIRSQLMDGAVRGYRVTV